MFDDRKATGNPGRITCCGAQGESQQQFPDEAPNGETVQCALILMSEWEAKLPGYL